MQSCFDGPRRPVFLVTNSKISQSGKFKFLSPVLKTCTWKELKKDYDFKLFSPQKHVWCKNDFSIPFPGILLEFESLKFSTRKEIIF